MSPHLFCSFLDPQDEGQTNEDLIINLTSPPSVWLPGTSQWWIGFANTNVGSAGVEQPGETSGEKRFAINFKFFKLKVCFWFQYKYLVSVASWVWRGKEVGKYKKYINLRAVMSEPTTKFVSFDKTYHRQSIKVIFVADGG